MLKCPQCESEAILDNKYDWYKEHISIGSRGSLYKRCKLTRYNGLQRVILIDE